ncbi:carbon-nitrogen hydrolase family protein [Paraburkholderia kururiensis]|uniref:carbon-nitrogen hydrolase family protein n=1 Tax=Paraburkholderia kururiensis TaxID=984307 RepID=UPI0005AB3701|nr:carbon-nitrogen hydrolase family protein [Paraburkholderia kururiensis]
MSRSVVAALQIGASPRGKADTLQHILSFEERIRAAGAKLVIMPEALLGGYPKGEIFGTRLGYRLPEGREAFARYYDNAIDVPGPETDALAELATRCEATLVIGVIERAGSSLYCTALFFNPGEGLVAKHRKLMPTGTERLIWAQGDGSTLPVVETAAGKAGAAICWENHMPLLRTAMYAKGVQVWCAPTVDEREVWQCSMRHIAHEGRCFVVSACQVQPSPAALGIEVPGWNPDRPLINGGSVIVGPLGDVLAGPLRGETGLVTAEIDTEELVRARYDFDVVGHYARPDVFSLAVDERPKRTVAFQREA